MPNKARSTANLVSDSNLYVDPSTDRVGIGTTIPTQKLEVQGNVKVSNDLIVVTNNVTTETHKLNTIFNAKTVTSNYALSRDDGTIYTNGTLQITLPTAVGYSGDKYFIKNVGVGTVTIKGTGSETIDGYTEMIIENQNSALSISSNGTRWLIF